MGETNETLPASSILKKATELDISKRYTEALIYYEKGLESLIRSLREIVDPEIKKQIRNKTEQFLKRAEIIKRFVNEQKENGNYRELIHIEENSIGYSFESLLGRFLDTTVTTVHIKDSIKGFEQIRNLVRLFSVLIPSCPNLKNATLLTKCGKNPEEQAGNLENVKRELLLNGVTFNYCFTSQYSENEISLDNGWVIKIGRGINLHKPPESKFSMGFLDLDLRPCYESSLDIIYTKNS